jgi:hypothetical protein
MGRKKKPKTKGATKREVSLAIKKECAKPVPKGMNKAQVYAQLAAKYHRTPDSVKRMAERDARGQRRVHGQRLLLEEEENVFVDVIRTFSLADMALSSGQLVALLKNWKNLKGKRAGEHAIANIISRHSKTLSMSRPKSIASSRKAISIRASTERFIKAIGPEMEAGRYNAIQLITYDEMICSVPSARSTYKRVVVRGRDKSNLKRGKSGKAPSILTFVSAAGKRLLTLIVYPTKLLETGARADDFPLKHKVCV